jgi:uncharacterized protein involved in outer membrane biogenesis
VLNRIYIVVGLLAILALAAAFVVPRFIQWGNYRDRMQLMASEALGTPVEIQGDIHFNLLPQPQLQFADVVVGPTEAPIISVADVRAEFSLLDFLRDRYAITRLVLDRPSLNLTIDPSGFFLTGINLPDTVENSNISIGNATIRNGDLTVHDLRAGDAFTVHSVSGDLKLQALRGPFSFAGRGAVDATPLAFRVSTSAMDSDGSAHLTAYAEPDGKPWSASIEGILSTGLAPRFTGDLTYRQAPPSAERAGGVRGDMVLTAKLQAMPDQILMPNYALVPDENRSGTRLTGAAVVHLGKKRDFDAVVSGGVASLPPRDATAEEGPQPYELVRLLGELPTPIVPPIAGTLGIDLAELDLRGLALRDLRLDASTDGKAWTIKTLSAHLPGETDLAVSGRLAAVEGRPSFAGKLDINAGRLDALAQLWRKPSDDNPLFNLPAELSGSVALDGDDLKLSAASFTLDGESHAVGGTIGFGPERHLDVTARFGTLGAADAAAIAALLPETGATGNFGVTFPEGRLTLAAASADLFGLAGRGLSAEATWATDGLFVTQLSADDYGGLKFDLGGHVSGTLAEPRLSGGGTIAALAADAPALARLYDMAGTPETLRAYIARSLPANVKLTLEEPASDGKQVLTATGKAGAADLGLSLQFAQGLKQAFSAPISLTAELAAASSDALTAQLGLGDTGLFPEGSPVRIKTVAEGAPSSGFAVDISAAGGGDSLDFNGKLNAADLTAVSGDGDLRLTLDDGAVLARLLGAEGVYVPGVSGSAKLTFTGDKALALTDIAGTTNGKDFSGELHLTREGAIGTVAGRLQVGELDTAALASVLGGPAALLASGAGPWPDGPLSLGNAARTTRGSVAITAPALVVGDRRLTDVGFTFGWDEGAIRLRDLKGQIGGGSLNMDFGLCCSGDIPQKRASGRVALDNVALADLLPSVPAANLSGTLSGSAQFNGTGASIAEVMASLAGEGSYSVKDLSVAHFDPGVFKAVAGLGNIVDMEADALQSLVAMSLDRGPFAVESLDGAFTIAGGIARTQNLSAESGGARLFGGTALHLADLGLDGTFSLTPTGPVDDAGLITPATSQVTANLSGSLVEPQRQLDLGAMTDTIKMKAYENELARLEQLQKEDEARQKAAAAERARLMAEQKRIAEEEAAKKDAEDAARKAAEEQQQNQQNLPDQQPPAPPPPQTTEQPMDLDLPPPIYQPSPSFMVLN